MARNILPPVRRGLHVRGGTLAALTAGILLIAAVAFLAQRGGPSESLTPQPVPTVVVTAGEITSVDDLPADAVQTATADLDAFLQDLYERAFLPPFPAPSPRPGEAASPEPTPIARPPVAELFTAPARDALDATPDVFAPGPDVAVRTGDVRFSGILTAQDGIAQSALLDVTFSAEGVFVAAASRTPAPVATTAPLVALEQTGTLMLVRVDGAWRVGGFELRIAVEREVPRTPEPSP